MNTIPVKPQPQNQVFPVFDHEFVSTRRGFVSSITSYELLMTGKSLTMISELHSLNAATELAICLQGSRNSTMWHDMERWARTDVGRNELHIPVQRFPLIRVFVQILGVEADAMFSVELVFGS